MWNIISGFDTLVTDYNYNSQDQITDYSHTGLKDEKTYRNTYDYAGRLKKVEYYTGPPDAPSPYYISLADYEYNPNSQVSKQQFNDKNIENVYSYNNRNWIASMTNSQTIFDYTNSYFLNGNVKSTELSGDYKKNFASSSSLTFDYSYDKSNRLKNATTPGKVFNLENTYDKDGNILTLDRNGSSANSIDNFNYAYYSGTNKLQRVTGSGTQYTYDANGNMTSDMLNKNTNIKYDHRNLILELTHTKYILNDSLIILTKYYYDESGNRIRKMSYNTSNNSLMNDIVYSRDVSGRELAIYENGSIDQWNIYGMDNIGFIDGNEDIRFYMKDHLGSVRAVTDGSGGVISSQDYDAWGYLLENRVYESDESIYKFTSKERDDESKYDYFGYRYYDSRIARWAGIDPLFEKHIDYSPYSYVLDNPLLFIDLKGADIDLSSLPQRYRNELVNNLSLLTGLSLYEENGLILYKKDKDGKAIKRGGSSKARKLLKKGINSKSILQVFKLEKRGSYAITGGLQIGLNPVQIENFISGTSANLNKNTLGWGMVFLHEMLHTEIGNALEDPKMYGPIGEVEPIINEIRNELGEDYGNRLSYQALDVYDGFKYIPFDLKTKKDIENNVVPSTNNLFIKHK